ncbi:glycosyltransferase family 2 protein [Sulfitobacter mediterraneus]|uniref:glycosyltransferase family 2 protein n=1 Tax=Sulfitobacter mediterraneus TaxID=83219 RepID=UPI0019320991|nr:glycosyltransferase family 2 protein [Sulfitobacter mediterraneus]MBM1310761.1 glycosyltransferase family 2 protein [Sulfitobacter mediterraneus]MBM1314645.1 glycosyltransferase family 2 protein [Sulfitobacter mediterraneus]MBM1323005.1 glycosyltransferase family 2 protein [Sulfitobacter mediterraneus]MBM1326917.1 glycosyltransferase family 2 protein [Sulfitobacter mediterraneus]MBM1398263.1 glycosyltransferase family 2 protein [Sulfitobacter mediterraneus]
MAAAKVLVLILNYRTAEMTLRAAEAALADMPVGAEMILIDNASGDGSAGVLQRAITERGWDENGLVRLILSDVNGGFGAGNNLGLTSRMSDGSAPDYFYVLNSDAFPDAGCLPRLITHLESHPKAGFAGSHVRGEDDVTHCTAFRFPSIAGEFEGAARTGVFSRMLKNAIVAPPLPDHTARVDWVAGASVLVRAKMLDEIGLFDETFFLYFEETDLCKRAARAGWSCWYLPQSRVVHIGSVSTGMKEWQRMPSYWFDSRRHYFVKNHGSAYAAAALVARLAGGAIHHLRCAISGKNSQDPAYFLRDLARHGFGLSLDRQPATSRRPATEDRP